MRKYIKILLLIISIGARYYSVDAQKNSWTIGLYTGMQVQQTTAFERDYILGQTNSATGYYMHLDSWYESIRTISSISTPPMELTIRYNITDNFSVSSGIGYANYLTQWKQKNQYNHHQTHIMHTRSFSVQTYLRKISIQIPCNLRYDVPLKNTGFSIFPKLGLYLDFPVAIHYHNIFFSSDTLVPVHDGDTINAVFDYSYFAGNRKFNLLINAGLGIAYQFKSGVGLSLSGEYSFGIMRPQNVKYNLQLKNANTGILENECDYYVYNRCKYWNVLLGITYTFKKKDKNKEQRIVPAHREIQ